MSIISQLKKKELQQVMWGEKLAYLWLIYCWPCLHPSLPPLLLSLLPCPLLPLSLPLPPSLLLQPPTVASSLFINTLVTFLPLGICGSFYMNHFSLLLPLPWGLYSNDTFSVRPLATPSSIYIHNPNSSTISQDFFFLHL